MNKALRLASDATIEALELDTYLELLARETASDAGRERVAGLTPSADAEELAAAYGRARECERLLEDGSLVSSFEDELLPLFDRLAGERGTLEGTDLLGVRRLLRTTAAATKRVESADPPCPELARLSSAQPDLSDLEEALEKTLDDRGRVREDASSALAAAVREARRARQSVFARLERYARENAEHLAEETVPLHGGRLVVLLRAGAKGRLKGLVHGKSGTGKSLYFEPLEAVDDNNRLQEALATQEEEQRRLLGELVDLLSAGLDRLAERLDWLAELDLRQAATRLGARYEGRLIEPTEDRALELLEARHPLLDPRLADLRQRALGQPGHLGEVVPLTMTLGESHRALVITGPNAGGKTVALKTAGLLAALAHCSLPVPVAAGSRIPRLERLVATVGDEQDLLTDRSTFSGRLLRLREAWAASAPGSLVLVDELGSGTDPEEGAALAVALLEELVRGRALAVLTSHLTPLAAAALELEGAGCAAMEFDPASGEPTFELVSGPPGSSEAISLARRLGLPERWLERAEELLGPGHRRMQELLREVETLRDELAVERREVRRQRADLEREVAEALKTREEVDLEKAGLEKKMRLRLQEFRRQVTRDLRREYERIREELESGRKRGLVADSVERLFEEAPEPPPPPAAARPLEVGDAVRHTTLGWRGEVRRVDGKRIQVTVTGKRVHCRAEELEPAEPAESTTPIRRASAMDLDSAPSTREIHLLGRRVEEALEELDSALDRALLTGIDELRVVHGHGTGTLKKAVRRHLKKHPAVVRFRPGGDGEGGDGATVVDLAD